LLIFSGHRRIGTILGPEETSTGRDCGVGFKRRLTVAGITSDPALQLRGPFDAEVGRVGLQRLMSGDRPPTAIFCGNDVIAIGALNAASVQGVRVSRAHAGRLETY